MVCRTNGIFRSPVVGQPKWNVAKAGGRTGSRTSERRIKAANCGSQSHPATKAIGGPTASNPWSTNVPVFTAFYNSADTCPATKNDKPRLCCRDYDPQGTGFDFSHTYFVERTDRARSRNGTSR